MMRSPPPPASQNASQPQLNNYGNPYQSPPAAGGVGGIGFGQNLNFINDPTAQMGFQVGSHAVKVGQDYVEQNVRGRTALEKKARQRATHLRHEG